MAPRSCDDWDDEVALEALSGHAGNESGQPGELEGILLEMCGEATKVLLLLQKVGPEEHRAIDQQVIFLKELVASWPSEPVKKAPEPMGFKAPRKAARRRSET